jgi:hypothetical protein
MAAALERLSLCWAAMDAILAKPSFLVVAYLFLQALAAAAAALLSAAAALF